MRRRGRFSWAGATALTLLVLGLGGDGHARRPPAPACTGGRFLLPANAPPLVAGGATQEVIVFDDTGARPAVSIASGCGPVTALVRGGRRLTTLTARWKRCGTLRKVRLAGRFDAGCDRLSLVFAARGRKPRRVQATRSACGDGVVDQGGGEQCEIAAPACPAARFCDGCRCLADVFAPGNAWGEEGEPLPPDATVVTPEEFERLAQAGGDIITKAMLAEREAAEAARVEADRRLVEAAIARDPRVGRGLTVTPPPGARSTAGGFEVDLATPSGVRPVVLNGPEYLLRETAAALRNFPARANQERMYRLLFDALPPDQRDGLPDPAELGQFADDAVADLRAEVVRRADDALPNEGPRESGEGATTGLGLPQASGECTPSFYGLRQQATWPLEGYTTPVRDQAGRNTCAAHAIAAGFEAYLWKFKGRSVIDLSEQELYAYAKGRWFYAPYAEGLPTPNVIEVMDDLDFKLHTENAWYYNPSWNRVENEESLTYSNSCADYQHTCSDRNHQMGQTCTYSNGKSYCLWYTHPEWTGDSSATHELRDSVSLWNGFEPENSLQTVRAYLAAGYPVVFAFNVDQSFRDATKDDPWLTYPDYDDIGGHAVLVTGYKSGAFVQDIPVGAPHGYGGHFYVIKNSWGCDHGDAGYVYAHTDWVIEHAKNATAIVGSATSGLPSIGLAATKSLVTSGGSVTLGAAGNNLDTVEFYEGFSKIHTDISPPFQHTITYGAADNSTHYYFARGYDPVGDFVDSNVISVKVDIDNVPPTVSLLGPPSVATPPGNVVFTASASDNKGVTKVEFFRRKLLPTLQGATIETLVKLGEDAAPPYQFPMTFGAANAGANSFRAIASDAAGNKGKSDPIAVNVVPLVKPFVFGFTATPDSLPVGGGPVTLAWNVAGANTVTIDNGVGVVTGLSAKTVNVTQTTTFTLSATNAQGTTTRTVGVNVLVPLKPLIQSFTATPGTLPAGGGQVTLAWGVIGEDTLSIDQGVGDVTGLDQIAVPVAATTTFTLTATNAAGSSTKQVAVSVTPPTTTTVATSTTSSTSPTTSTSTTSTSSTTVTTVPGPANLRPTQLDVVPGAVDAGGALDVSWTVVNEGGAAAAAPWQDGLWLNASPTPGGTFFGDTPRGTDLAAGASYTAGRTVTLPNLPAGTYSLVVRTDRLSTVPESQESDNDLVSVPVTIRTPDLRPTAIDVAPTVMDAGGTLDVSWIVTNEGTTVARATWQDGLWLNTSPTPGGTFLGDTPRGTDLAAGASYTAGRTVTLPNLPAGTYYLVVRTDRLSGVYEGTGESDNDLVSVPVTIRTPDLRPTAITATKTAPGTVEIAWTITNEGTARAIATWQDGVWLSPAPTPGGTFAGDTPRTTNLAPGASYAASTTVNVAGLPAGTYHAVVRADRHGDVYEGADEGDNDLASSTFTLP